MNRLGITTPERGLVLEIIIWNNSTQPLLSPYYSNNLWILIQVSSTDTQTPFNFRREIAINNLYLPPNESDVRFVNVDNVGGNLQIGSYTATLTWGWGQYSTGQGTPIEQYPFHFTVMTEQEFQQKIQQNKGGTTYVFPINITINLVEIGVPITLVALSYFAWKRKKTKPLIRVRPEARGGLGAGTLGFDVYIDNIGDVPAKNVRVICKTSPQIISLQENGIYVIPLLPPKEQPLKFNVVNSVESEQLSSQTLEVEVTFSNMENKKQLPIKENYAISELVRKFLGP